MPEYTPDRYRFDRVRGELKVIRALDRALSSVDLLPRDRDRWAGDSSQMRAFRDDHE